MTYNDIDSNKKAFVFELDNVLFPEKDYLLQVYYLFAGFLEYTELLDAKTLLNLMTGTYYSKGLEYVFIEIQDKFKLDKKYRSNFEQLLINAQLPLKLLLYKEMLALLQEIVTDRKQIFIVTDKDPQLQLNKIRQTEWHGLDKYLTCYFTNEFLPMPKSEVLKMVIDKHGLTLRDVAMISANRGDEDDKILYGIDRISIENFLTHY